MKYKGIAVAIIIGVLVLLGIFSGSVGLRKYNERMHSDSQCYHNMKILSTLLETYAQHNDYRFPPESEFRKNPLFWKELVQMEFKHLPINESWFYCPLDNDHKSGSSYEFNVELVGKDLRALRGSQVVLLKERAARHNGKGNVMYLNI